MNTPSPEQRIVLDHLHAGKNVIVNAVAGSGKSTTVLSLAAELPHMNILQVTYNKMLRHEVKEKTQRFALKNLEVHTYHSAAVKHYTDEAAVDTGIRHILTNDLPCVKRPIPAYDIVVLDECQDMSHMYFQLMQKVLRDMDHPEGHTLQLLVLGDEKQCLYEFRGADSRFLTMADRLWGHFPYLRKPGFERCTLRVSYRITRPMARFINEALMGEERMIATRNGPSVVYIRRDLRVIVDIVVYQIHHLLSQGDTPADFFILANSVKSSNYSIRDIGNALVERGIPIHVPSFDADELDDSCVEGKVVFSTFHAAKGRERKHVFVTGFDAKYFSIAKELDKTVCPNTLYVASTRATRTLFLCEDTMATPFEFLRMTHHDMRKAEFVDFKGHPPSAVSTNRSDFNRGSPNTSEIVTRDVAPSTLTRFLPDKVFDQLTPLLDRIFVVETLPSEEGCRDIPRVIRTKMGLYEDVSDLNGVAIPAFYYDHLSKDPSHALGEGVLRQSINAKIQKWRQQKHKYALLLGAFASLDPGPCRTIDEYLYLSNVFLCAADEMYFKLRQIDRDEYTWLSPPVVSACMATLDQHLGTTAASSLRVETTLVDKSNDMYTQRLRIDDALFPHFGHELRFKFIARVDAMTPDTLWELKCTTKLTVDHLIQTAVYAWIHRTTHPEEEPLMCKILNIRTGEVRRLEATTEELTQMVVLLLRSKFAKHQTISDTAFLAQLFSPPKDKTTKKAK
jgi:hypothetical protein